MNCKSLIKGGVVVALVVETLFEEWAVQKYRCRGDVHDDLAGALHDVGVVQRALPPRASLGDPVIFCPFPTRAGRVCCLCPRFSIGVGPRRSLARLTARSVGRSVPVMEGEKGIQDYKINVTKITQLTEIHESVMHAYLLRVTAGENEYYLIES